MKVSIVIAILNSHEIMWRQLEHFGNMNLPEDVEVVFVDDGSEPSLIGYLNNDDYIDDLEFNFSLHSTNNFGIWTQPAARNFGAKQAKGEYCIFTDIDHIISREVIEIARNATDDVIRFRRELGVLDENGDFTQDWNVLRDWGYDGDKLNIRPHGNSYIMRTGLYLGLGGVSEKHVGTGKYPNREEVPLKRRLKKMEESGRITIWQDQTKPKIYMFPNGHYCNNGDKDFNPFGFFHNTTRSIRVSRQRQREAA